MRSIPQVPEAIDEHRDAHWRRESTRQVETVADAERFVEQVGFAACLTDARRPGPSLYVAVCGRRDAVMPRNVQKDSEASLTWLLKDDIIRRGKAYYATFARGKAMFLAPRMIPYFPAVWGLRRSDEKARLSANARAILAVLRREWEMSTGDLREDSGVKERTVFTRAMDELQAAMIVVPWNRRSPQRRQVHVVQRHHAHAQGRGRQLSVLHDRPQRGDRDGTRCATVRPAAHRGHQRRDPCRDRVRGHRRPGEGRQPGRRPGQQIPHARARGGRHRTRTWSRAARSRPHGPEASTAWKARSTSSPTAMSCCSSSTSSGTADAAGAAAGTPSRPPPTSPRSR